jgi:pimeloyl-ACP methyl ester carboxylesterase
VPAEQDFIQLEVFGRTNNAYRWAGERDVYEALEAVRANYRINPARIVLRGFSMGGAGTWHIGLHDPSRWAAIEAGAGFTDTVVYAKQPDLPPYQRAAAHIYDAVDYSLNAINVPTVGYGGEDDAQLQASVNIREALTREGYSFKQDGLNWTTADLNAVFLVGPKTGHSFHPDSKASSNAFIDKAVKAAPRSASEFRFVTYSTRYGKCFWLEVDGLRKHYERAEVNALRRNAGGGVAITLTTTNVSRLVLSDTGAVTTLTVDGQNVRLYRRGLTQIFLNRAEAGTWSAANSILSARGPGLVKRTGLQGPIDDAFVSGFVCARPTRSPYHAIPGKRATATLDLFQEEYPKWLRAALPVTTDLGISREDIAEKNLILFGDPSSNVVLQRIAAKLPIIWTAEEIIVGKQRFDAANHILAMIYPNPLNPERYVVINSGHTFHETEFRGTNALLFPRLGDYAVLRVDGGEEQLANPEVVLAGFFDEEWRLQ